jgi:inner membrane protein
VLEFLIIVVTIAVFAALGYAFYSFLRYFTANKDTGKISLPDFHQHLPTRLAVVFLVAITLLIPLGMIEGVVGERHRSYSSVLQDIGSRWGYEQILTGPILVVPFQYRYSTTSSVLNGNGVFQDITQWHESNHQALILPDGLTFKGNIDPEYRQRSIYKSLVYRMQLRMSGQFLDLEKRVLDMIDDSKLHNIAWDKAYLSIGLSDPSGVEDAKRPFFNNKTVRFSPGSRFTEQLPKGLHIPLSLADKAVLPFDFQLELKGSQGFRVAPLGERTSMQIQSTWEHPSFYGDLLPKHHELTKGQGFTADWSVSRLVRSFPQQWIQGSGDHRLDEITLGVKLFEPVTLYTETTRAVKYGILFVGLTFVVLLLLEWITGARPGFLQYFMIGASLSLFYLLLIALAEHTGFALAYLSATIIVIGMIGLYSLSILKRRMLAALVSTVLTTLYSVLYLILQSEDYALLSGTILITVTLAASMYFTRGPTSPPVSS